MKQEVVVLHISENENIFEYLESKNIEFDKKTRSSIIKISKKQNNNYIGYYQFYSNNYYYKIYIIPKIFLNMEVSENELTYLFIEFLKQYYRLKIKYGNSIKTKDVDGNITDLIIDNNLLTSSLTIDDFLYLKFMNALKVVQKFFQRHKRQKYINKIYSSQSIHHKLDLASNIRSIDKSLIHQIRKETLSYSKLASISLFVLKGFKHRILQEAKLLETKLGQDIETHTNYNINSIQKRFTFDKQFSISTKELLARKTSKLFAKNREHKELYSALLLLLGFEYFEKGCSNGKSSKIENIISIFFKPDDLYEWVVYDYLNEKYDKKVLKDKLHNASRTTYFLNNSTGLTVKKSSEPDFVVTSKTNEQIIIDAKWKVPSSFNKIHYDDVTKLKRDCMLRNTNNAILIYPKLPDGYDGNWYFDDDTSFKFKLEVCDIMHKIIMENK
jgi:hypothetical protein